MSRPGLILGAVVTALAVPVLGVGAAIVTAAPADTTIAEAPSASVTPDATPAQIATTPSVTPSEPPTAAAEDPLAPPTPTLRPTPHPAPASAPTVTPQPSPSTKKPDPKPAHPHSKTPPTTPAPVAKPAARPAPVKPRSVRRPNGPASGWSAPDVHIGSVELTRPTLKSGQRPELTVACSPSAACTVSGSTLVVSDAAQSVTVTWYAPATKSWTAWSTSRSL